MKQAKHPKGLHGHPVCGNCARTVPLRHGVGKVACTAHLTVMSIEHGAECAEYMAIVAPPSPPVREEEGNEPTGQARQ